MRRPAIAFPLGSRRALDTLAGGAAVAQWIEHLPPKERVAGSIPASRTSLSLSASRVRVATAPRVPWPRFGGSSSAMNDLTVEWADGSFHQAGTLCAGRTKLPIHCGSAIASQVGDYQLSQELSTVGFAETVQLGLKSLGLRVLRPTPALAQLVHNPCTEA